MRKHLISVAGAVLLLAFTCIDCPAQGGRGESTTAGRHRPRGGNVPADFARAEQAWPEFFSRFRGIVRRRDLEGLKGIMSDEFFYPCALDEGRGPEGEGKEFGIKKFGDSKCSRAWITLSHMIKKGPTELLAKGRLLPMAGEMRAVSRILPRNWITDKCQHEIDFAVFEFKGNRWMFAKLDFCETE